MEYAYPLHRPAGTFSSKGVSAEVENCQVVQVKTMKKENTNSLQVGAGPVKLKNVNKPLFGHYASVKVEPKRYLTEFKVSEDAFLPVGRYP